MKDRGGWAYLQGFDVAKDGTLSVPTHALSRARQEEKALGLSGRQRKKWRKACRRNMKAFLKVVKPLDGLVNLNTGEQGGQKAALPEVQALREAQGAVGDSSGAEGGGVAQDGRHGSEAA